MEINMGLPFWGSLLVILVSLVFAYFRLSSVLIRTDQVLSVWEYIAETPILCQFVGRIFTIFVKIQSPYCRSIDFQITSLEVGRCRGQLYRRRTSDGPFHCTHGIALTLFAETVAGLAVFSRLGSKGRGILLKTETEYVKKAKGNKDRRRPLISGSVIGFAAFDPDEKDHILEHVKCDVMLKDSMGEVVARVPTRHPFAIQKANTQCVLTFKVEGMELHNMRA